MSYIFRGTLCGYICPDCPENLSNVTVRLYRLRKDQQATALVAARTKETFQILSEEEVAAKDSALLAETETDAHGRFEVAMGEEQEYDGEAFQIDVRLNQVPGREEPSKESLQFTITTVQPRWRQREEERVSVWEHCIAQRFWCRIRARFDAWVICGRVVNCETQGPVGGLEVSAFDTDWWQDDPLGSAVTKADGRFRIDYTSEDFKQTPFSPLVDVELIGGPDLWFTVASDGTLLLEEPRSRGRDPDRENAGVCFCVELCVDEPVIEDPPLFTHIGDFNIISDIDTTTGRTQHAVFGHGGPDFGFMGQLKLKGFCPQHAPGDPSKPLRYRFLYVHPDDPGTEVPMTGGAIFPVKVGVKQIMWDIDGDGTPESTFQDIVVAPPAWSPPSTSPPPHVIHPDSQGWVTVDTDPAVWGDAFGYGGALLGFRSGSAVPGGSATASGDAAGDPPVDPKDGAVLKLIFEAEPVGGGLPSYRDELQKLHVNNWAEVRLLNLEQFISGSSGACTPLSSDLNILYTADHELMRDWKITIDTAASVSVPSLPSGTDTRPGGVSGNEHVNISGWPSCSYQVRVHTRRALTDGEDDDGWNSSLRTFCK
jgi:hypothetical protein